MPYASKPVNPALIPILEQLQAGQKVRITHTIRVGMKSWPAVVTGAFRHLDSLATGLATERLPQDDVIVPILHFTKDNGELSSVALDEHTKVEVM